MQIAAVRGMVNAPAHTMATNARGWPFEFFIAKMVGEPGESDSFYYADVRNWRWFNDFNFLENFGTF